MRVVRLFGATGHIQTYISKGMISIFGRCPLISAIKVPE